MVGTKMSIVIVIAITLALGLGGCQKPAAAPTQEVSLTADEQKAALLKQIETRYESPAAHYQLGRLYHAEGRLEKAVFEYQVALGFDPVLYKAQAALVEALKDKQDIDRSNLAARMYIEQAAISSDVSMTLGKAFQNEGLDEFALVCYQQAQGLKPESAIPYKAIGYYYLDKGDKILAEENLRKSFELNPYQPDVAGELGRMGVMVQIPHKSLGFLPSPTDEAEQPAETETPAQ